MQQDDGMTQLGFRRPGKGVLGLMLVVFVLWLTFAIGLNWGGASTKPFELLIGDTRGVWSGEVWRLLTAGFMHLPKGDDAVWHLLGTLLGLYFLGTRMEEEWGTERFVRFVLISNVIAYTGQLLITSALPADLANRVVVGGVWFGMVPAVEAIAIAWALTFRGQVVRFMMVLPMTSGMLIVAIIALSLLHVAAGNSPFSGMLAPFLGMGSGWLLGGGSPSPLRRAWLKLRLSRLEQKAPKPRKPRPNPGGLRVITGGRADDDDDKGPDGRWLN
jgi:membrane associated rhomboid family serine protease